MSPLVLRLRQRIDTLADRVHRLEDINTRLRSQLADRIGPGEHINQYGIVAVATTPEEKRAARNRVVREYRRRKPETELPV